MKKKPGKKSKATKQVKTVNTEQAANIRGGETAGRANFQDFKFTQKYDKSSPVLFQ
jgi:type VI protein secretion system component Hcp